MATRMQQRRGTAAQWTSADPILAAGEIGFETDTGKFKIGNGTSEWSALSYFADSQDFDTTNFVLNTAKGVANGVATLNANGHVPISQLGALIANAPESLNTLEELADALEVVDAAVSAHSDTTTGVHGIADTSALATKEYADNAVSVHRDDTTNVHGIVDTSLLATQAYADGLVATEASNRATALSAHSSDTTGVHGIADTSLLATTAYVDTAVDAENTTMNAALSAHSADTTNVHGIADTTLLATKAYVDTAVDAENTAMNAAVSAHSLVTTNVHGIVDTAQLETQTGAQSKANAALTSAESYADSAVSAHNSDKTNVHGIANTDDLVLTNDARLSDERTPLDGSVTDAKIDPASLLSQSSILNLTTDLAAKASLESPTFTGTVNLPNTSADGNIVPSVDNTYDLGSPTKMWKDIYVGPGSLYVNGQKVLQDESGNIVISADANENLSLRTSGSGNVELDATGTGNIQIKSAMVIEAGSNITSSDGNAVVFGNAISTDTISSKTTNTDLSLSANGTGKVYLNDNAEVNGNLVVGGNLTVSGTTTTVNSETISLADNIIDLNSNFTTGTPTENAGVRIKRGDSADVQLRWNESTDVWEFTNDGANYSTLAPLDSPTFTGTVSGVTKSMVGLGNVDNTSDADKPISTATQTALNLKASTADLNSALLYSFNNETSSYTLVLSDATNMVEMESSSATTVTVPTNSSVAFPIGTTVDIFQKGTGQVTVAASGGVTIYATPGLKLRTQYSGATLIKRDTNTWILTGDLSA